MKKLIEHIKRQISCFKSEKSKACASQNDKLSLGGRIAALEELLADISTDDRPLTPEILTAAGYKKLFNGSYVKEIDNAKMEIIFNNIGELSIYYSSLVKIKALVQITVGEFNTLLDIVKLNKFKIK